MATLTSPLRTALAILCFAIGCDAPPSPDAAPKASKPAAAQAEPAKTEAPPDVKLLKFKDKSGHLGFTCNSPAGKARVACGVVIAYDTLHLAGPIGTRIELDDEEYVLGKEHALDKQGKSMLRGAKLHEVSAAEAHLALPWPGPSLLARETPNMCSKGPAEGPAHAFEVTVRLPGSDTPLEAIEKVGYKEKPADAVLAVSWSELRNSMGRTLEKALDGEAELPPLRAGAKSATFYGTCYGPEIRGLADLRYVARRVDSLDDDSLRRKKKCGRYRSSKGYIRDLSHTMSDTRLEIWDVRAGKRVAQKTLRAKAPKCPSKIKESSSGKYASVDYETANAWLKGQLKRLAGPPIEPGSSL